jgi:hypothetical protein
MGGDGREVVVRSYAPPSVPVPENLQPREPPQYVVTPPEEEWSHEANDEARDEADDTVAAAPADGAVSLEGDETGEDARAPGIAAQHGDDGDDARAPPRDDARPFVPVPGAGLWLSRAVLLAALALAVFFVVRGRLGARHGAALAGVVPVAPATATVAVDSAAAPSIALSVTPEEVTAPDLDASASELAHYEREEAKRALEARRFRDGLEIAQRAVEHDSGDAEGWLILAAACLDRGDYASAQRAYKSCVERVKGGRRAECLALLR